MMAIAWNESPVSNRHTCDSAVDVAAASADCAILRSAGKALSHDTFDVNQGAKQRIKRKPRWQRVANAWMNSTMQRGRCCEILRWK